MPLPIQCLLWHLKQHRTWWCVFAQTMSSVTCQAEQCILMCLWLYSISSYDVRSSTTHDDVSVHTRSCMMHQAAKCMLTWLSPYNFYPYDISSSTMHTDMTLLVQWMAFSMMGQAIHHSCDTRSSHLFHRHGEGRGLLVPPGFSVARIFIMVSQCMAFKCSDPNGKITIL